MGKKLLAEFQMVKWRIGSPLLFLFVFESFEESMENREVFGLDWENCFLM